jgi:methylmalonyl-CoA mutase
MSSKNLFEEFNPLDYESWKLQIEKDLKGKDFDSLLRTTNDGIELQPFYNERLKTVEQGFRKNQQWNIVQEILVEDEKAANKEALTHLNKGANSLLFYLDSGFDLTTLLSDILLEHIQVHFVYAGDGNEVLNQLKKVANVQNIHYQNIYGSINVDSFENLARTGNWFQTQDVDLQNLHELIPNLPENLKGICVNTSSFANAGASISQQLGIVLAISYEYVHQLNLKNTQSFWFGMACGSDYFGEIAKLRAFRRLWVFLQEELNMEALPAHIYAETSTRNKTILDANNNMIRSTTEAMSAIIGGCDELSIKGFDAIYKEEDDFSRRIAKNQQSILQHESHLDAVKDMSKGSYFIEHLTEELCKKGWAFFKEIESHGGYLSSLKSNWLQNQIEEIANTEQQAFDEQSKILIGANKYQKADEDLNDIAVKAPFYKPSSKTTAVQPLKVKRLSEELEKL